jgi:tetratricopeptide (TPR) repeat protein
MEIRDKLQKAIAAAHAGRELMAREMFLDIVEAEPNNELAWLWLIGLLDALDDRIYACKKVLTINPTNTSVQKYLAPLVAEKQKKLEAARLDAKNQVQKARDLFKNNHNEEAITLIRTLTQEESVCAEAWQALADLSPLLNEQVLALENLLKLTPGDIHTRHELQRLQYYQQNPLEMATFYEEQGELEKAVAQYNRAALHPNTKDHWDTIYKRISKVENLRLEKITYIPPIISIARLTFGPSLLYLMLMLIQVGINPLAHPNPLLWLGFVWVLLGGFMIALASVHSPERLKFILVDQIGARGIPVARSAMAIGWILVLFPHLILFVVAWQRLTNLIGFG